MFSNYFLSFVAAPARRFEVAQSKPEEGTVNITCKALGVYPLPKMVIYQEISGTHKKGNITGQTRTVLRNPSERQSPHSIRNETFDIAASALVLDRDVTGPTVIGCELSLPEANYTKKKSIVYYPGKTSRDIIMPNRSAKEHLLANCHLFH